MDTSLADVVNGRGRSSVISQLIARLQTLDDAPEREELARLISVPIPQSDLDPWVHFDPHSRCRTVIHHSSRFEVVVVGWLPGQSSSLHDHGSSTCVFRVLSGEAQERRYLSQRERQPYTQLSYKAQDVARVEPGEAHEVRNPSETAPLVTLHIYSPPLAAAPPLKLRDTENRRHVIIVGGGFSGAVLAAQLRRHTQGEPPRITLIESSGHPGPGLAYRAEPWHLLNARAASMSAFPEEPDHFLKWARRRGHTLERDSFAPRSLYGEYLQEILAQQKGSHLEVIAQRALGLRQTRNCWEVTLGSGAKLVGDVVVLATGHGAPLDPSGLSDAVRLSPFYAPNPWSTDTLAALHPGESVLIIGTGLTMIDLVLSLRARRHAGPIYAFSRRGILPAVHLNHTNVRAAPPLDLPAGTPLRTLVREVRKAIAAALERGEPWQTVIDGLRRSTPQLWHGLSPEDRQRFVRHVRTFWEAHRHRQPPQVAVQIESMLESGQLHILSGHLKNAQLQGGKVGCEITTRAGTANIRVDRVLNATGPGPDLKRCGGKLLRDLIEAGHLTQDLLRLGVRTDEMGRALNAVGQPTHNLYVLGPARRAADWEATAVPELSQQATDLAHHLLEDTVPSSGVPGVSLQALAVTLDVPTHHSVINSEI